VIALRNGRPANSVPAHDRGLAYGDGLFETLKAIDGHAQFLELHLARLQRDCARLDLRLDLDALRDEIARVVREGRSGVLKLIATRRAELRGYQVPRGATAERLVLFYPQSFANAPAPSSGVRVRLCRLRLAEQPALAGMKHLNRLEQVRARAEWSDPDIAEGLLFDTTGRLVEAVASNVFLVRRGAASTPRLHRCGVAGVVRELLLRATDCAPIVEADLTLDDLLDADEVFLTNSIAGIQPVLQIDCLQKARGDVTIAFQNYFQTLCSRDAPGSVARIDNQ
jgi:4-amino-4-deoxychorismate lyase